MKITMIPFLLTFIAMGMIAQPSNAQSQAGNSHNDSGNTEQFEDVPEEFRTNLTEAVEAYLHAKDALLESDAEKAVDGFKSFKNNLEEIGRHSLTGDGHAEWMKSYTQLTEHSAALIASDGIETILKEFRPLSEELAEAVKKFGVRGVIYHQYCPMALDSDGSAWLSSKEQIQNPYTPETMPGCGEVIEKIES